MHKIKHRHAYLSILLVFFIQVLLSNFLAFSPFRPNLLIIITFFFALFTDEKFAFKTGLLSGILLDIFSIRFLGLNTFLFSFSSYIIGKYNHKFYKDSIITHVILTFMMSFFILSVYFLFVNLHSPSIPRIGLNIIFSPLILIPSLFNSFLGIWIYAFFLRIFRLSESTLD